MARSKLAAELTSFRNDIFHSFKLLQSKFPIKIIILTYHYGYRRVQKYAPKKNCYKQLTLSSLFKSQRSIVDFNFRGFPVVNC